MLNYKTIIGALNGLFSSQETSNTHLNNIYDSQDVIHKALMESRLFGYAFRRSIGSNGELVYALKTPVRTTKKILAIAPVIVSDVGLTYDVYINSVFTSYGEDVKSNVACLNRYNVVDTTLVEFRKDVTCSDFGISVLPEFIPASKFSGGSLPSGLRWVMTPDAWAVMRFVNTGALSGTVRFATYFIELDAETT